MISSLTHSKYNLSPKKLLYHLTFRASFVSDARRKEEERLKLFKDQSGSNLYYELIRKTKVESSFEDLTTLYTNPNTFILEKANQQNEIIAEHLRKANIYHDNLDESGRHHELIKTALSPELFYTILTLIHQGDVYFQNCKYHVSDDKQSKYFLTPQEEVLLKELNNAKRGRDCLKILTIFCNYIDRGISSIHTHGEIVNRLFGTMFLLEKYHYAFDILRLYDYFTLSEPNNEITMNFLMTYVRTRESPIDSKLPILVDPIIPDRPESKDDYPNQIGDPFWEFKPTVDIDIDQAENLSFWENKTKTLYDLVSIDNACFSRTDRRSRRISRNMRNPVSPDTLQIFIEHLFYDEDVDTNIVDNLKKYSLPLDLLCDAYWRSGLIVNMALWRKSISTYFTEIIRRPLFINLNDVKHHIVTKDNIVNMIKNDENYIYELNKFYEKITTFLIAYIGDQFLSHSDPGLLNEFIKDLEFREILNILYYSVEYCIENNEDPLLNYSHGISLLNAINRDLIINSPLSFYKSIYIEKRMVMMGEEDAIEDN